MSLYLVQTDSTPPDAGQLRRAFRSLQSFTDADAVKLAKDAAGVLIKNLSLADATVMQRALLAENVSTAVVESDLLPKPPPAKVVRRMELHPESLAIYDVFGRALPVPYSQLRLLSAGVVRHLGMTTQRCEEQVRAYDPIRGVHTRTVTEVRHKVGDYTSAVLDVFLTGGGARYRIEAATFSFKYCFERAELDLPRKLGLLIEMLVQRAPQTALNRGARALLEGNAENAAYASKVALEDESVWFLWRMASRP